MATDDAVVGMATLTTPSGKLIIRPTTSGEEWTIHNVYVPAGTNVVMYRSGDPTGTDLGINLGPVPFPLLGQYSFHCTTTQFLILVNGEATEVEVGYDGVVSNSP